VSITTLFHIWIALYGNISLRKFHLVLYKTAAHQFPAEILTYWYQTTYIQKGQCFGHFTN